MPVLCLSYYDFMPCMQCSVLKIGEFRVTDDRLYNFLFC